MKGGRREGAGRKKLADEKKSYARQIYLKPDEWEQLARESPDGSATKEAARRIRKTLLNF